MMRYIIVLVIFALGGGIYGVISGHYMIGQRNWLPEKEVMSGISHPDAFEPVSLEPPDPSSFQPCVSVESFSYDFGILEKNAQTEKGSYDFKITNTGKATLTLKEAGKGCMCTSFKVMQKSLLPGDSTVVHYEWDASRSGGIFSQGVRVTTNDPKHPELTFSVQGLYSSPVMANPGYMTLNNVSQARETVREFHLFGFRKDANGAPIPLKIEEVLVSDPEHFVVSIEEASLEDQTEEEKKNTLISHATSMLKGTIKIAPGLPMGAFQEVLQFRTNDTELPILELPLEGKVSGAINISGLRFDSKTGVLMLGSISQKEVKKEKLRIIINDPIEVNQETVSVKSVRPNWLKTEIAFPDPGKTSGLIVKIIELDIEIPKNAALCSYVGPTQENMGEVVLQIGKPGNDKIQEINIPVQFAVIP